MQPVCLHRWHNRQMPTSSKPRGLLQRASQCPQRKSLGDSRLADLADLADIFDDIFQYLQFALRNAAGCTWDYSYVKALDRMSSMVLAQSPHLLLDRGPSSLGRSLACLKYMWSLQNKPSTSLNSLHYFELPQKERAKTNESKNKISLKFTNPSVNKICTCLHKPPEFRQWSM